MKNTIALMIVALLSFALTATADEPIIEKEIRMKIVTDSGEIVDMQNLGDMEIGDVETIYTDSGTPVVIERTESGFTIEVEGEEPINIDMSHDGGMVDVDVDCDGADCDHNVIIKKHLVGDGDHATFINEDGTEMKIHTEGDHVWIDRDGTDGDVKTIDIRGAEDDAIARLLASGVLDDLTPEKRHEILQALSNTTSRRVVIKKRIEKEDN